MGVTRRGTVAGLLATGAVPALAQGADTLAAIKARGKLVVGCKNDYRPYGFLDPSGAIVGSGR